MLCGSSIAHYGVVSRIDLLIERSSPKFSDHAAGAVIVKELILTHCSSPPSCITGDLHGIASY